MSDARLREAQREAEALPEALERYRTQLLRSCSFLECWLCGVLVPEQLMPDHDKACRAQAQATSYDARVQTFRNFGSFHSAQPSASRTLVASTPSISARPRREPLYDTASMGCRLRKAIFYIRGTLEGVSCQFLSAARRANDPWLTNVPGRDDWLPSAHAFYWYRATLIPDHGQCSESVLSVWRQGKLRFQHQAADPLLEWPCMAIMVDPKTLPKSGTGELAGLACVRPRVDVTVSGQSIQIHGQERIDFALDVPVAPAAPVHFTVLMYGLHARPIAGE